MHGIENLKKKKLYAYGFWGGVQQGWNHCTHFVPCGYTGLKVFIVFSPQSMVKQPLVGQDLLVIQDSRSHSVHDIR